MKFRVAHSSSPMVGETANGDRAVFRTDEEDRTLIAVIDALGHGPGAAVVADAAAECLAQISLESTMLDVVQTLHAKLAGSRGAAGTLCLFRERNVEACAVGNVELRCADLRLPLVFSAGVLGARVAKFHVCRAVIPGRARCVLFSDGISLRVPLEDVRGLPPDEACNVILTKYRRKEDDSTVLVADME